MDDPRVNRAIGQAAQLTLDVHKLEEQVRENSKTIEKQREHIKNLRERVKELEKR